jgi:hypothetical protein
LRQKILKKVRDVAVSPYYYRSYYKQKVWRKPGNIQTMAASFYRAAFPERLYTGILNPATPHYGESS